MTAPTHVPIAGLRVPVELVPRIVAAFRGTYPELTLGLDDDASVRAVLRHWVSTTLASFEGATAEAPVEQAVERTREEFALKGKLAREKALQDATAIVEAPPTPIV